MAALNYKALGLRCGLEIHQELETNRKLFCHCPAVLQTKEPDFFIMRTFRPVLGEMGKFDEAMLVEYEKKLTILYEGYDAVCCTYEIDETPPFEIDMKALEIGIQMGLLLNLDFYNEFHVCRKNYLDGSVTCGFQRTLLIGSDGYLMVDDKKIGITTIAIEEDAARKIKEEGKTITYRLDRLGIPLIELVTDPDMNTPDECMSVAYRLGLLLRSTGLMKRGLGTIRQDVNVSIEGGARVEIKGVQKLEWIPSIIETEVRRQLNLLKIRNELVVRNIGNEDIPTNIQDVTQIFSKTNCKFMKAAIKEGQKVFAVKCSKIAGILGFEILPEKEEIPAIRFGKEIAQKVTAITGLKGIIHSDEDMNNYGFKKPEITALKKALEMDENDAFIMVVAEEAIVKKTIRIAINRIQAAIQGVPNETRKALENGSSEFIRELHGGSRLYPDTDSLPILIKRDYIKELSKNLPELPWDMANRLKNTYEIDEETINKLILHGYAPFFEEVITKFKISPVLVATTLLETLKSIKREGYESAEITETHLRDIFELIAKEEIAKEAIDDLLKLVAKNPSLLIKEAIKQLELMAVSLEDLEGIINDVILKNKSILLEKEDRAFSPMMGEVMKFVRGKIDGKVIAEKLREAINNFLREIEEKKSVSEDLDKVIEEILTNNEVILREKGADVYNILFIKLKKRLKGQIEEKLLSDKLKSAINDFLSNR
ncbi:MAG TPA: Glu-tRNA(Gln) amidotransferase subunit GatE [Candidatus Deferrimicrobium sp.]|nr:Glu-tRNA(Gln) amidotransferase subunit GatE [Candidatus Deferrimicrobium sp.]